MCAYAPGVENRTGEILARGMADLGRGVGMALAKYEQRKEEKKKLDEADFMLERLASAQPELTQAVGLKDPADKGARKAVLEALGGARGFLEVAPALAQYGAKLKQEQTDTQALKALFGIYQQTGNPRSALNAYAQAGGSPAQLDRIDQLMKTAAPQPAPDALEVVAIRETGPNGEPIEVTRDKRTGAEIARGPVGQNKYVLTPQEQIAVAGGTESAKQAATQATEYIGSVVDAAEGAQQLIPQLQKIRELYAAGATSGFAQDFVTQAGALAARLGIGSPEQQANREELQKLLANTALQTARDLMKGSGAVSNYERELVNKASAEVGKTPAANLRIIELSEALANRSVAAELQRQKLVDEGKSTVEIAEKLRRWRTDNPLSKFIESAKASGAPEGVEPALWNAMTPEEKALFAN